MKRIFLLLFLLTAMISVKAQDDFENKIFEKVEKIPFFPTGMENFYKFISTKLRYPAMAMELNIQGKVEVSFVVERDGSITDVKTTGRKLGYGLEEEAIRVVKLSPKWTPGVQNGKNVRVKYNMPISFKLSED